MRSQAVEKKYVAKVPVWFEGHNQPLRFTYDAPRLDELLSQTVIEGADPTTCRMWLYAGVDPEDAPLLVRLLEHKDMAGFEGILIEQVLDRLNLNQAEIGGFDF